MPAGLRTLSVCADDFGLSPGVSAGIAQLVHRGRVTAVSCMSNSLHWACSAPLLHGCGAGVGVGLHVNLTEGVPRSAELARLWPRLPGLPALMARAHLGYLPRAALRAEVRAQVEVFRDATGRDPVFVDGHHHVHQLPVVRGIVLDTLAHLWPRPAVRSTAAVPVRGYAFKRWVVARTGARALAGEIARRGLARNPVLLGFYDFRATDYGALVRSWLGAVPPEGALLFCHPGLPAPSEEGVENAAARLRELAYLGSDVFIEDLASAGVRLGSVWQRGDRGAP